MSAPQIEYALINLRVHSCRFPPFPSYPSNHSAHSISPSRAAASTSKRRTRAVRRQRVRTSFPLRAVKQYVRNKHDTTVAEASRGKASNQEEKSGASELRSAQPDSEANRDHKRDYDKLPCINQMGQSEINGFAADYRNLTLALLRSPSEP